MPRISVIVPIYKVEQYLPRCIDSILAQTFTDFELILVDDGSPDNCGAICDEYAAKDSRIRVIHKENQGLVAARNAGIDASSGEWIAFVDSDDWIHKDYLKILYSGALDETEIVICGCVITDEYLDDIDYASVDYLSISMQELFSDHIARTRVWGRIFSRQAIGDLRFISGTEPVEDSCFNELFYHSDLRIRITDAKLYYYYMRPGSVIFTQMGQSFLKPVSPLLECLDTITDPEKRRRIISRCYKYVFSARYGEMYTNNYADVLKKCRELFSQLKKYLPELSVKDRMIIRAFSVSPSLYRAWRIHDDPTLLNFEREKKRRRAGKINQ